MREASNCKAGDKVAFDSVLGVSQGREAILILNLSAVRSHQIADKVAFDCVLRVSQGREPILIVNHCDMRLNRDENHVQMKKYTNKNKCALVN